VVKDGVKEFVLVKQVLEQTFTCGPGGGGGGGAPPPKNKHLKERF